MALQNCISGFSLGFKKNGWNYAKVKVYSFRRHKLKTKWKKLQRIAKG
jgi:hypothetical protein